MITAELRWFFKGSFPRAWKDKMAQLPLRETESRTDFYLPFSASETCGLKWREGRLEAKVLIFKEKEIEHWEKRTVAENFEKPNGDWISVEKSRRNLFWDERQNSVNPEEENHCQLEFSELRAFEKIYHSFCLEATAGGFEKRNVLVLKSLEKIQEMGFANQAKMEAESYPAFLRKHTIEK